MSVPDRRLSSEQMEAVIRRAVELQARSGDGDPDDGIAEAEVLRIGSELGLEPGHLQRALAEVRGRTPREAGVLPALIGPGLVRAARTVQRPASEVGRIMENYLVRCEYMVVQRRLPDRTRYVPATGVGAALGRAAYRVRAQHTALGFHQLDVGVSALDDESTLVELSMEIRGVRNGLAAGGIGVGGGLAAVVGAFALATPVPDVLALAGLPALAGTLLGFRGVYRGVARSRQEKLESLLDRLEHGELGQPKREDSPGFDLGAVKVNFRLK